MSTRADGIDPARLIAPCDVLLIVPPFSLVDRPSLGVHQLQACARAAGFSVGVVYANLWFARWIGVRTYHSICQMPLTWLIGERLFCRSAYGVPALGNDGAEHILATHRQAANHDGVAKFGRTQVRLTREGLEDIERKASAWLADFVPRLTRCTPAVVGVTTTFEQTAPGLALLRMIGAEKPDTVRIIGGANCEGEMADGIRAVAPFIDHVFSGESEASFVAFLRERAAGRPIQTPIIRGQPCTNLDALPTPDFSEYYRQFGALLSESDLFREQRQTLPFETSRGCWWGQKSHCTFCGLNGEGMGFRQKTAERVIEQLDLLATRHPGASISMADNIMPHNYFRTLLPRLAEQSLPLTLFYEQKSNLTLAQMRALASAGVVEIQPGIEALSTPLLKLMAKGVTAARNIAALRYARAYDVAMQWNMLYGFPGDALEAYEHTLDLLPLLRHLEPPGCLGNVLLSRFSPYFNQPAAYGITDLEPMPAYADVLPAGAPSDKVAYFFDGEFKSGSLEPNNAVIPALDQAVRDWNTIWRNKTQRPSLHVRPLDRGFELIDTRGLAGNAESERIGPEQACFALGGGHMVSTDVLDWALERRLVVHLDGRWVALATADPTLLERMEQQTASNRMEAVGANACS